MAKYLMLICLFQLSFLLFLALKRATNCRYIFQWPRNRIYYSKLNIKLFNHIHSSFKTKNKLNFYSGSSSQMYFLFKNKLK
jgi:hypothetical protein